MVLNKVTRVYFAWEKRRVQNEKLRKFSKCASRYSASLYQRRVGRCRYSVSGVDRLYVLRQA